MKSQDENIAYIGLGSNKGDRVAYLNNSINNLNNDYDIKIVKLSNLYETKPFGLNQQDNFCNAAAKLVTSLTPQKLLKRIKQVEEISGRTKSEKWGPREIDIDLLLFNDLIFSNEFISLPHEGIIYRDFVLQPLCDLDPDLIHPVLNRKLSNILAELKEKYIIKILPENLYISGKIN